MQQMFMRISKKLSTIVDKISSQLLERKPLKMQDPTKCLSNEAQARELAKPKNPYHQIKAWQRANETYPGKVTAARLKTIVKEIGGENIGAAVKKAKEIAEGRGPSKPKGPKGPTSSMDPEFKDAFFRSLSEIDRLKNNNWQGCGRTVIPAKTGIQY